MFDLIGAALAFAITMFFLSTVAATFVETIHRFLKQREKGLELMLGHFYDRVVAGRQSGNLEELRQKFVDLMTVNRAPTGAGLQRNANFAMDEKSQDRWTWFWNGRRLASLNVNDFMNRLGSSEFGDALRAKVADPEVRKTVLADIALKFEAFGTEASGFFQARARLFCVLIALVTAYLLHVHPLRIFSDYLTVAGLADKVNAMQDTLVRSPDNAVNAKQIRAVPG